MPLHSCDFQPKKLVVRNSQPAFSVFSVSVRLCSHPLSRTFRSNLFIFTNENTVFQEPLPAIAALALRTVQAVFLFRLNSSPIQNAVKRQLTAWWLMARNRDHLHFPVYVHPSSAESAENYSNNNSIHDQILSQPCSEASFTPKLRKAFLPCLLHVPFKHHSFAGRPCITSWTPPWTSKSFWDRYPTLWDCFIALSFMSAYGQVWWIVPCYSYPFL